MPEALQGKNLIILFRILKDAKTKTATKLAFQTEHELTESKDSDSIPTKDGNIAVPGALETELDVTSIMALGDTLPDDLREALRKGLLVEIWEVNLAEKGTLVDADKYKATYFQGYVTEWSRNPNAEDALELSISFVINGEGQDGFATLTAGQEAVVQYVFKDTVIETTP